jgi:iron complex outermembrane receptor protein
MIRLLILSLACCILPLMFSSSPAIAQPETNFLIAAEFQADPVQIKGKVTDAQTGEGISHAYMHFNEVNRSLTTQRDGSFTINNILPGRYTLYIHRIGYETRRFSLEVPENGIENLKYELNTRDSSSPDVIVEGQQEANGANLEHASLKIAGDELRRNMGGTLSKTLENSAGFSQRSLGPAPGRPVIRGLSGERVLVLQDRLKTGDVSSISADHAVTSDPMAAREIELARGPAALEYSGNAVGGVINVVKERISGTMPGGPNGSLSLSGETVSSGASSSGSFQLPFGGHHVLGGELNADYGLDFNTPEGEITNSYTETFSNALSYSHIRPWGYSGITASVYSSDYGIPPDPNGGHPQGVDIEMNKFQLSSRSEVLLSSSRLFKQIETTLSFTGYEHQEIESNGSIGTEFVQNSYTANLNLEHRPFRFISRGKLGAGAEVIDYRTAGSSTSDATRTLLSAFSIQEADKGRWHFELGNRLELATIIPEAERTSSLIGQIRRRDFIGLASSASAIYRLSNSRFLGGSALMGFRPPSVEELYSEGPHLAAYTFEIGNPDLSAERSIASEIFIRQRDTAFQGEIALYYNYFSNYIFPRDTGQRSVRYPDLNNFQFEQAEAHFLGAEASFSYRLNPRFRVGGNLAFTRAERAIGDEERQIRGIDDSREPLPLTPPLNGLSYGEWSRQNLTLRTQIRFAAAQDETDQFETATDGYAVWDASLQYIMNDGNLLHTVSLRGQNLSNTSYRNHLSLIKDIFPEPGRNVSLLYRVYF